MFKIAASPAYWITVEVPFLLESGSREVRKFDLEFERLTHEQISDFVKNPTSVSDREFLVTRVRNWRGVADEGGATLEFTRENFERLLEIVPVQQCAIKAFFASIKDARAGN